MSKKIKTTQKKSKAKPNKKVKSTNILSNEYIWIIISIVFPFLLYISTTGYKYTLDDDLVAAKNKYVQEGIGGIDDLLTSSYHYAFTNKPDRHYRPMAMIPFAIENINGPSTPEKHHFFNVFWYAICCGLIYIFLRMLLPSFPHWFALGAALLFAAHPVHTEVVANIKSRDEINVLLGLLVSLISIIQYDKTRKILYLVLSLIAYFLACLSKENGLQIIALIPLTLYFIHYKKEEIIDWKYILTTSAFFLIPVAMFFGLRAMYTGDGGQDLYIIDNILLDEKLSFGEYWATVIYMLGDYLRLLIYPINLSYDYSSYHIPIANWGTWQVWASIITWAGILFAAYKSFQHQKVVFYGVAIFLFMFALVSNVFILTGFTMTERGLFSPSLGFSIICAYLAYHYLYNINKNYFFAAVGLVVLLYSARTFTRLPVWENNEALHASGIISAPNSARTNSFYGNQLYQKAINISDVNEKNKLLNEAMIYFDKSIEINPYFGDSFHRKGQTLEQLGRISEAKQIYLKALEFLPDYVLSLNSLGVIAANSNNQQEASEWFYKAVQSDPYNLIALTNLAISYKNLGRQDDALNTYLKAHELKPSHEGVLLAIVEIYKAKGDIETAIFYDKKVKDLRGESY